MKKLLSIILILSALNAYGVTSEATGSDAASETVARTAVTNAIIASSVASNAARQARMNQSMLTNTQAITQSIPRGVMICDAVSSESDIYDSCSSGMFSTPYPINEYFQRYKPTDASKIILIIFDREHREFQIYYQ